MVYKNIEIVVARYNEDEDISLQPLNRLLLAIKK